MGSRESEQLKFIQLQFENVKKENSQIDEQITNINHQCKQYQNQMEVCFFDISKMLKLIFGFSRVFVVNLINLNKMLKIKN